MTTISVLSSDPAAVNCGIITGSTSSLIVDAGPCPDAGRRLADRAARLRGRSPAATEIDLVITHDHWDHWFGAAALLAAGAGRAFASSSFATDQEGSAWLALDALRHDPATAEFAAQLPVDPGELFVDVTPVAPSSSGPAEVDLGGCRAEFHVLEGHSTADLVVRLPDLGVVFVGDLIEEGDAPQAGADASLSHWTNSLRTVLDFAEATTFVPGHGVPVDRRFVQRQLADIDGMRLHQDDAEVALPARTMPGDHDRRVPRELRLL
ncbi:MBL fold metallo-hydrolase [Brevibacterium renqingii]|uniref:MBL fold metallo-hydrolase n=1 Tax=Brevibacterium renqingii TaxID=2776916 RepID=UPI001AE0C412|nr:MBL fold metallo-hydrolase [Brevibacterium renqingii]